ncbi:MAG: hypothetical protein WAK86_18295, partial [Pseudonocardiaceae bacterium]
MPKLFTRGTLRRLHPSYAAVLGAVLSVGTVAATAPAASAPRAITLAADSAPCGTTGNLTGSTTLVCTYTTSGSDTFTVPAGVTALDVDVVGAQGGQAVLPQKPSQAPGAGGEAKGTISVTPGAVLQVDVASAGGNGTATSPTGGMNNGPSGGSGAAGGFGGSNGGVPAGPGDAGGAAGGSNPANGGNGSGGGGSSDVRLSTADCATLTCGLDTRALVGP